MALEGLVADVLPRLSGASKRVIGLPYAEGPVPGDDDDCRNSYRFPREYR